MVIKYRTALARTNITYDTFDLERISLNMTHHSVLEVLKHKFSRKINVAQRVPVVLRNTLNDLRKAGCNDH